MNFLLHAISSIDASDIGRTFTTNFAATFIFKIFTEKTRLFFPMLRQCEADNFNVYYVFSNCLTKICKKDVFRNFAKFTGKHLYQSLFFNKVVGLRPATLLKKRLWYRCFPVNFAKFLITPFIIEHLW